ncbi:hypothetical protein Hanom_Chr11g00997441 [Helianthus anomalus]
MMLVSRSVDDLCCYLRRPSAAVTGHGQRHRLQWRWRWWVLDDGGGVPMKEVVGGRDDGLSRVSEGGVSIL